MKSIYISFSLLMGLFFSSFEEKPYPFAAFHNFYVHQQIMNTVQMADSIPEAGTASFEVSGAWEGEKKGKATAKINFATKRNFATILIEDIDENNPEYILKFRVESWEPLELPSPGKYQIIHRGDPESGYDVGFEVTYTQILKYGGGHYYANTALEYKAPVSWMGTPNGEIVIESVTESYVQGSFEFELWENASINKAPSKKEGITVKRGKFKALINKEKE